LSEQGQKIQGTRKIAYLGLLTALAILLGYVESLIPFDFGIPGVKLGLCNVAILFVLQLFGWREAVCVTVLRVLAIGFLFGNMFSILYSLAGTLLSILVMTILSQTGFFDLTGVSAAGGTAHNIGQLIAAVILTNGLPILWYLPILMAAGVLTGCLIGIIETAVLKHTSGLAGRREL